ncbi:hypothetical protein TorRG33x02_217250 [Trema orientale]|uniref:Uncharacterized protein n=1 Tax=Trema orientale TaxID=63057 RepID=A0A2P5EAG1_TREOI|nr:hypothetical protein TorRG33x02_217250 [Trema orientale]
MTKCGPGLCRACGGPAQAYIIWAWIGLVPCFFFRMSFLTNKQFLLFLFQNLLVMVAFGFGTAILKL